MQRIAFAGDLHKRAKDITTIEGYVKCNTAVQLGLMETFEKYQITHFVHTGDWYDKGYTDDVSASLADYDLDVQMASKLNGNFYGVIGNHIRLNLDSNPELHLIQPHEKYTCRRSTLRTEQIIKTPDILRVGDVQISLMHHDIERDELRYYKPVRQVWAKYHVAVFHTEKIVPTYKLADTQYSMCNNPNTEIARCLQGVDLAIVGHIHDAIGSFNIQTETGTTMMIVPGSLTNVNSSERGRHSSIRMPILTVHDDGRVELAMLPFDLKTNMVTFKRKGIEDDRSKLRTLRGKPAERMAATVNSVNAMMTGDESLTSLNAFMLKQGYTDKDKKMIRSILNNPEDLNGLFSIWLNVESSL